MGGWCHTERRQWCWILPLFRVHRDRRRRGRQNERFREGNSRFWLWRCRRARRDIAHWRVRRWHRRRRREWVTSRRGKTRRSSRGGLGGGSGWGSSGDRDSWRVNRKRDRRNSSFHRRKNIVFRTMVDSSKWCTGDSVVHTVIVVVPR